VSSQFDHGIPPAGRRLGDLLGPVGGEYIQPLCVKWQLDPDTWTTGDAVPRPLDEQAFARSLQQPLSDALDLDDKMTTTFASAIAARPEELLSVEFAAQPIGKQANAWWELNYGKS
jgi:hypothetical protein